MNIKKQKETRLLHLDRKWTRYTKGGDEKIQVETNNCDFDLAFGFFMNYTLCSMKHQESNKLSCKEWRFRHNELVMR